MIKSLISKTQLPLIAFAGFAVRLIAVGASVGDAIAMFALAGLVGLKLYIDSNREEPVNDQVRAEIAEVKNQMAALNSSFQLSKTQTKRF